MDKAFLENICTFLAENASAHSRTIISIQRPPQGIGYTLHAAQRKLMIWDRSQSSRFSRAGTSLLDRFFFIVGDKLANERPPENDALVGLRGLGAPAYWQIQAGKIIPPAQPLPEPATLKCRDYFQIAVSTRRDMRIIYDITRD